MIAILHIGPLHSQVHLVHGTDAEVFLPMPVGALQVAQQHFRRLPPTPLEMEHAIQTVEDAVMPVAKVIPPGTELRSADAAILKVAQLEDGFGGAAGLLTLEAVERMFNRLADIVAGRPAQLDSLPMDGEFAATLLILREFMHHLQLPSLRVI